MFSSNCIVAMTVGRMQLHAAQVVADFLLIYGRHCSTAVNDVMNATACTSVKVTYRCCAWLARQSELLRVVEVFC
jgi:hypothetical protein